MGEADCDQILREIHTFLDGELTADVRVVVQGHLEDCPDCLEVFDFEAELRTVIVTRCQEPPPDGLQARIARALSEAAGGAPGADGLPGAPPPPPGFSH